MAVSETGEAILFLVIPADKSRAVIRARGELPGGGHACLHRELRSGEQFAGFDFETFVAAGSGARACDLLRNLQRELRRRRDSEAMQEKIDQAAHAKRGKAAYRARFKRWAASV